MVDARKWNDGWKMWLLGVLGSALTTTALGAWYLSGTLTGINAHLKRLDDGQQGLVVGQRDIMAQHQGLANQMETVKSNQIVVITFLHDKYPDIVPLPDTSEHDGFQGRSK